MDKKLYHIRKLEWKRYTVPNCEAFSADTGPYKLRVRTAIDGGVRVGWIIMLHVFIVDQGRCDTIEEAKAACEAVWVDFLEKHFLEED